MNRFALTAIGRDRPGIVASVTKVLFEHDCNIEDSSMTILEDEFAMILIMSAPEGMDEASLNKDLACTGEEMGLTIHLKEIGSDRSVESPQANHIITLHGADKAGIVFQTTELLRRMGVNITDLETKTVPGPEGNIYIMVLEVYTPEDVDIDALSSGLEEIAQELGVTIKLKPIEEYEPL